MGNVCECVRFFVANGFQLKKPNTLSVPWFTLKTTKTVNSVISKSRLFLEVATAILCWALRSWVGRIHLTEQLLQGRRDSILHYLWHSPRREKPSKKQRLGGKASQIPIGIGHKFSREENHHSNKLLRAVGNFLALEVFKSRPDPSEGYVMPLLSGRSRCSALLWDGGDAPCPVGSAGHCRTPSRGELSAAG